MPTPTTPVLGADELVGGQAIPETTVNETVRRLEQGAAWFQFKDRDLAVPPGARGDGDCYLVAAGGSGFWSGKDGQIAYYQTGTGWLFIIAREGMGAGVQDENIAIAFLGGSWTALATGSAYTDAMARAAVNIAPSTQSGTSYTAVLGDAGGYIQFTNAAAIAFTIPPNSSVAFAVGTVITIEQAGAGVVTITAGAGVTLNSRGSLVDTAGQYAVAQIKKVATDTWTIIGDVA
ncbi:MAG: DUF2793 domain-containing protein [Alphaproteobacteria bacterium]|nr:DUF2793 domain-containing protein [Alphaproteobacteria bacterium]